MFEENGVYVIFADVYRFYSEQPDGWLQHWQAVRRVAGGYVQSKPCLHYNSGAGCLLCCCLCWSVIGKLHIICWPTFVLVIPYLKKRSHFVILQRTVLCILRIQVKTVFCFNNILMPVLQVFVCYINEVCFFAIFSTTLLQSQEGGVY